MKFIVTLPPEIKSALADNEAMTIHKMDGLYIAFLSPAMMKGIGATPEESISDLENNLAATKLRE